MKRALVGIAHAVWMSCLVFVGVGWFEGMGKDLTDQTQVIAVYAWLGSVSGIAGGALRLGLDWLFRTRATALGVGFGGMLYGFGGYLGARAAIYVSRYVLMDRPWFEPTALTLSLGLLLSGPIVAHVLMMGLRRLPLIKGFVARVPGRREAIAAAVASLCALVLCPGYIQASEASRTDWTAKRNSAGKTGKEEQSSRPNIILYVVDAVRHDHVSFYGYDRKTTPVFDRLAQEGVAFDDVHSTSCWSLPAAAGMLASRRAGTEAAPGMLGTVLHGTTLPEVLADRGYATLAVSNNPHVVGPYGVGQRFDHLDPGVPGWVLALGGTSMGRVRSRAFSTNDADLTNALIDHLDDIPQPFFTYIHVMGAHAPYEIPDGFETPFDVHPTDDPITGPHDDMKIQPDQRKNLVDRYDSMIRYADHQVGRLVDALKDRGMQDDTVLIYTADHGEEFGDHGHWTHGKHLYQEVVHVPFLMWGPGHIPSRETRRDVASLADIPPTAVGLAASDPDPKVPDDWVGVDLQPRRSSSLPGERFVLAEDNPAWKAVIGERYKYMVNQKKNEEWLFDRRNDPKEQHNLAEAKPEVVSQMEAKLKELVASSQPLLEADQSAEPNAALEERLRGLGYVE